MRPNPHISVAEPPSNLAAQTVDMVFRDKRVLDQPGTQRNLEVRNPQSPVDEPYVSLFPPPMKLNLNLNQLPLHRPQNQ
jgi:hypothetical protein